MKQHPRRQESDQPKAPAHAPVEFRIAAALERIADCFERLLEMAQREQEGRR